MHDGRQDGAVHLQLAPSRYLPGLRQFNRAIIETLERLGTHQVGPADQSGVVGHRFQIKPVELTQHQTVVVKVFGLFVALVIQAEHDEHPQDRVHRGRAPTVPQARGRAARQVRLDSAEHRLVLQEPIHVCQDRFELEANFGDLGQQMRRGCSHHGSRIIGAPPACSLPHCSTRISHQTLLLTLRVLTGCDQGAVGVSNTRVSAMPEIFKASATCPLLFRPTPADLPAPCPTLVIRPKPVVDTLHNQFQTAVGIDEIRSSGIVL